MALAPPDAHALGTLILTVLALYLFSRDRIPLATSSLLVLAALVLGFELFPYRTDGALVAPADFFRGFGHEALMGIAGLMICAKGLEATGALQPLARLLAGTWRGRPKLAYLLTLMLAASLSMFMNNTPLVAMLLPILVGVSIRAGVPTAGILMPVGYATIIGGMATTIGTSTNLLAVSIARDLGVRQFGMFDFTLPVVIAAALAIVFLWGLAPRLLPQRKPLMPDVSPRVFSAMLYVNEGSYAADRKLSEVLARTSNRMRIERVERGRGLFLVRLPSLRIQAGDRLYVNDTPDNLKEFEKLLGATLYSSARTDQPVDAEHPLAAGDEQLAEVVVQPGSALHHRTLNSTRLLGRHGLRALALHTPRNTPAEITSNIGEVTLRSADVVLVQGPRSGIEGLKASGNLLVLDGTTDLPHTRRAPIATLIMAGVVVSTALGLVPIAVSALVGVMLLLATGCLTWQRVFEALDPKIVLLIVTSLGLGYALTVTGATEYIARLFVTATLGWSIPLALSGFMLMIALLTEVISNNSAAVIGTPIAVGVAQQLGADPEPFVLAVIFGANMSYMTPIGYQTNLLVMSAGGYQFADFLRVGIPLQLIMWLALSLLLPVLYGL